MASPITSHSAHDPFLATLWRWAERCPIAYSESWFGPIGAYSPCIIDTSHDTELEAIEDALRSPHLRPQLRIAKRVSAATRLYYAIHELIHFYQDCLGFVCHPMGRGHITPTLLDAQSYARLTLFCEAMATLEAIRAAWRMRESGEPLAWSGALRSRDWRKLAIAYDEDREAGLSEMDASKATWSRFFELPTRDYYVRRAVSAYPKLLTRYGFNPPTVMPNHRDMRHVSLKDCLALLPAPLNEEYHYYLSGMEEGAVDTNIDHFPIASQTGLDGLIRGSMAYHWYQKVNAPA